MDTTTLKKFAQGARRQLLEQVAARMEQVLRSDSVEIREKEQVVQELREQIETHGKKAVVDKVAYTWFNRFCALRFMDVNRYTRIGVVTPVEGGTQPEVLFEAKQGHIDEDLGKYVNHQVVFDLLSGKRPSSDAQGEAYRLLLVGICNYYGEFMPFMFERIEDYTELLMPLDLLSENSVLHDLREALSPEACEDVEVIGWLYQYYISERKDKVFEALKQNQKIEAGDIPAATQLFTPHWIVRYLVENSLGRLWMLNHPNSGLREKMEYYIAPAQEETDFLRIASPEELRLLDPACGSGHILTYAFDLLAAIYEEEGYASSDIAKLILEKNIFGVEIDPRAGALAAFALVMKARAKDRRFFTRDVSPNICVLENVTFKDAELKQYMNAVGRDLFTEPLMETLRQFEQADNFGSLIRPMLTDAGYVRGLLEGKNLGGDLFLFGVHERVLKVLTQAEFLAPRYQVVVTNPPYMGSGGMNESLKTYTKEYFASGATDLYGCFIERCMDFSSHYGYVGMITIPNWMFISSFDNLRKQLISEASIVSLIHNGRGVWGSDFGSCSFILWKQNSQEVLGVYRRLFEKQGEVNSNDVLIEHYFDANNFPAHYSSSSDFKKVPGYPIAYWASERMREIFSIGTSFKSIAEPRLGMATGNNDLFIKVWTEVSFSKIGIDITNRDDAKRSSKKWFPYNKGGKFRRWYGNNDYVVNWENDGYLLQTILHPSGARIWAHNFNLDFIFKPSITWSFLSSAYFDVRYCDAGFLFDSIGSCVFPNDDDILWLTGFLCSNLSTEFMKIVNPTMAFQVGNVASLPIIRPDVKKATEIARRIIANTKEDWNSKETSWNFEKLDLLKKEFHGKDLSTTFDVLRQSWKQTTLETQKLEEANNRLFIDTYGLQNELTSSIPIEEITLYCNPYYLYGNNKSEMEMEELFLADTMKEFISYAVGCMFGRYSLDKPGLVLANQGETLKDYLKQVPKPTFMPDEDNAIPVLEGEWFNDDIAERFKKFLRITFGEEHYEENLAFIEEAIGRDIRSYFVKEFYKDHVQMYKKRPIYWMFSSPKGSFNALIYMHRYKPDTVSIVLNNYLREYIKKLNAHKIQLERTSVSGSASQSQKTKALKEITQVNKILAELKDYEDDVLYPRATQQIAIDLDDGVKVNYARFGSALAKIPGL